MNKNQELVQKALTNLAKSERVSHGKYLELLEICLAALEEPAQASESKQVDLKDLQFFFVDTYSEEIKKFSDDLSNLIKSGQLIAFKKELSGLKPGIGMFDEMHEYPSGPMYTIKFKDDANKKTFLDKMLKIWNKEERNVPFEPIKPIVKPEPIESKLLTHEGMKKILMNSGYAVIDNEEFNENYIDVRTLRNQTGYEKWLFKKANEFRRNVLDMLQELYKNERITFEEYADNVASIDSWRIAMNSGSKKEQLDELYEGRLKLTRASGNSAAYVIETEIKDGYAEISERLNEIADKVNSLYPLVKRIDSDSYIIKSGLGLKGAKPGENKQANVNKTLDDYPLTERQLDQVTEHVKKSFNTVNTTVHYSGDKVTEEVKEQMIKDIQNELAKSIREDRLKGGFK